MLQLQLLCLLRCLLRCQHLLLLRGCDKLPSTNIIHYLVLVLVLVLGL